MEIVYTTKRKNKNMNQTMRNKIAGAIYGFAIGDAMGATTEFMTEEEIERKFGKVTDIVGGGWLKLKAGDVTDDTEMTICVMKALMDVNANVYLKYAFTKRCARYFIEWCRTEPKDIGGQCSIAIAQLMRGHSKAIQDLNALGNGSLMRAMPCAILGLHEFNKIQGELTHNNPACSSTIQIYSKLVQNYLSDNYNINYCNNIKALQQPSGFISYTLHNSIYWSCKDSFEEAIIGAVNHGGDADTIAAITGSLAGAKFGYDAIPKRWINQLNPDIKNFLEIFKNFAFSYLQI